MLDRVNCIRYHVSNQICFQRTNYLIIWDIAKLFVGMSSGSSAVISHDSPQPSGSRSNSFIIQQYNSDLSARTATKSAGSHKYVRHCFVYFNLLMMIV